MSHDAFISYSRRDKAVADAVCAGLEARGVRCWIAPRDVQPGKDWSDDLLDAIEASRVMVLIFSAGANESQETKREVNQAVKKGIAIIPFRIEDVVPSDAMDYYLGVTHWLDALNEPLGGHIERLSEEVLALLGSGREGAAGGRADAGNGARRATSAKYVTDGNGSDVNVGGRAKGGEAVSVAIAAVGWWRSLPPWLNWKVVTVVLAGASSVLTMVGMWLNPSPGGDAAVAPRPAPTAAAAASPTRPPVEAGRSPFQGRRAPFDARVLPSNDGMTNLRKAPNGGILARLRPGSLVTVTGECEHKGGTWWCPVKVRDGWLAGGREDGTRPLVQPLSGAALAEGAQAKVVYERNDGLALRENFGASSPRIASLLKDSSLTVTGKSATADGYTWWPVRVGPGYVAASMIEPAANR